MSITAPAETGINYPKPLRTARPELGRYVVTYCIIIHSHYKNVRGKAGGCSTSLAIIVPSGSLFTLAYLHITPWSTGLI